MTPPRPATPRPSTRPPAEGRERKRGGCLLPLIIVAGVILVVGLLVVTLALLGGWGEPDTPYEPPVAGAEVVTLVVDPLDPAATEAAAATQDAQAAAPTVTLASKDSPSPLPPTAIPTIAPPGETIQPPSNIYGNSFETDDGYWPLGSKDAELGSYESSLVDGKYRLTYHAVKPSVFRRCMVDVEFDDFILSVDAIPVEGPVPFAYGVIFRKQEDTSQYYELRVNNKSEYRVNMRDTDWEPLVDWTSNSAVTVAGPNHLQVEATGSRLRFDVNGKMLTLQYDETWSSGTVCFFVWSSEGDTAIVDFDNLEIREVD